MIIGPKINFNKLKYISGNTTFLKLKNEIEKWHKILILMIVVNFKYDNNIKEDGCYTLEATE